MMPRPHAADPTPETATEPGSPDPSTTFTTPVRDRCQTDLDSAREVLILDARTLEVLGEEILCLHVAEPDR